MNSYILISSIILFGLTYLCFAISYYNGHKETGKLVGVILVILTTLTFFMNTGFLEILFQPLILVFQVLFIIYWIFRKYEKAKAGKIIVLILTACFLLLLMQPWIADFTYSKSDVKKVLTFHKIKLKDDFKIVENESGGF